MDTTTTKSAATTGRSKTHSWTMQATNTAVAEAKGRVRHQGSGASTRIEATTIQVASNRLA
jgi:hypothetical protein